jgi:type VI secretion system secreted protein Hcp
MAECNYFLKIDGVDGESMDDKHKGELQLMTWSLGVANTGSMSSIGGGGSGKATWQDAHFTKVVDKGSVKLKYACAHGEHLKKAVLVCCRAGGTAQEFYKVTFTECVLAHYTLGGSADSGVPIEQFALNFAKIETEYKPQKADGTLDASVKGGHDLKANKKV